MSAPFQEMGCPRVRSLLSLSLIGCMMLPVILLGCSSAKVIHPPLDDRPRVPDVTTTRLQACVDELSGEINAGYYTLDAAVQVDNDGRVVDVTTNGTIHPELAICMRIALRSMNLPEDILERGQLRQSRSPVSTNWQTKLERGQIGEVITITIVTIALADIIIDAVAMTIVVAVTVKVAADAAGGPKDYDERCREVKEKCIAYCSGSPGLPAPGGGRFRRCMRECMEANGCSF